MVDFAAPVITPPKINPSEITLTSSREREREERENIPCLGFEFRNGERRSRVWGIYKGGEVFPLLINAILGAVGWYPASDSRLNLGHTRGKSFWFLYAVGGLAVGQRDSAVKMRGFGLL